MRSGALAVFAEAATLSPCIQRKTAERAATRPILRRETVLNVAEKRKYLYYIYYLMSTDKNEPKAGSDAKNSATKGVKPGQEHLLKIEKLTFVGAGLARIDGIAVFVPGAIPGQKVKVRITRNKGKHLESKLLAVESRAVEEIKPRCQHFHDCGGCTWQNLPYDKQIDYKEEIVRETLEATGRAV